MNRFLSRWHVEHVLRPKLLWIRDLSSFVVWLRHNFDKRQTCIVFIGLSFFSAAFFCLCRFVVTVISVLILSQHKVAGRYQETANVIQLSSKPYSSSCVAPVRPLGGGEPKHLIILVFYRSANREMPEILFVCSCTVVPVELTCFFSALPIKFTTGSVWTNLRIFFFLVFGSCLLEK